MILLRLFLFEFLGCRSKNGKRQIWGLIQLSVSLSMEETGETNTLHDWNFKTRSYVLLYRTDLTTL